MINLLVGRRLTITGLTPKMKRKIKKSLTLVNPTFHILKRMGKYTGDTPRKFKYYKEKGDKLIMPRGTVAKVIKYVLKCGKAYQIKRKTISLKTDVLIKNFEMRNYQIKLIGTMFDEALNARMNEGVISMTTGAGKTLVALEIARCLKLTTTILVPSNFILQQFKNECIEKFGFEPGIIGGGKNSIVDITIATFQSLQSNKLACRELAERTSILIVDECQGVPAEGRANIVQQFRPEYLFGLSGTPDRTDGRAKAIFFYMGPIIAQYEGEFLKPTVEVIFTKIKLATHVRVRRQINGQEHIVKKRLAYHEVIDRMIEDKNRNVLVSGLAMGEMMTGRKVLVLTKRVAHYKSMEAKFANFPGVHFIDSKDPGRNDLLAGFKSGLVDFNGIFGTTSLLAVGTDIPALDTLIIACDIKSSILTTQSVGRILRLFEGKQQPKIIDLCDNNHPSLYNQYKERERTYVKKGWKVTTPWKTFNG